MSSARNRFSPEFRDRSVRMVDVHRGDYPSEWAAISSIAAKVGCTTETLRRWCREEASPKASWLAGPAAQAASYRDRVKALEREVKELCSQSNPRYGRMTQMKPPPEIPGRFTPNLVAKTKVRNAR
jgi:transposase-like protein